MPSPPEDLSWSPIDANSVRINWQPPKHPNGIITGYRIMYSSRIDESNLDLWNSKEEKGNLLSIFIFSFVHFIKITCS